MPRPQAQSRASVGPARHTLRDAQRDRAGSRDADRGGRAPVVRVWSTWPARTVLLRQIVARLRAAGHDVTVTARDYAQTLVLARRQGLDAVEVGRHGGASRVGKLGSLTDRTSRLLRWARPRRFDVALAHGSCSPRITSSSARGSGECSRPRTTSRSQPSATTWTRCSPPSTTEQPDVVVTDIRMPPSDTDEGIRRRRDSVRRNPEVGVVVLSQYANPS